MVRRTINSNDSIGSIVKHVIDNNQKVMTFDIVDMKIGINIRVIENRYR